MELDQPCPDPDEDPVFHPAGGGPDFHPEINSKLYR